MEVVRTLLIVVEAIISLLLIGVILLQRSKSEGLGLAFGSGMGETLFGSRAGNVLTRITIILAVLFLANTLVLANLFTRRAASLAERGLRDEAAPATEQPFELHPEDVEPGPSGPAVIPEGTSPDGPVPEDD